MNLPKYILVLFFVLIILASISANKVHAQTSYSRVFITSTIYNGNLGGLAGADSICQTRANAAGLGGTWKAWLSSTTTSASSRLVHSSVPYKLLNGTTIANDWTDLVDGNISNLINVNELGQTAVNVPVWTDTSVAGGIKATSAPYTACSNWTDGSSSQVAYMGYVSPGRTDYNWTEYTFQGCQSPNGLSALYCFDQTTVTSTAAPTPTPTPTPTPASQSESMVIKTGYLGQTDHSCVENSATHKIYCFGGDAGVVYSNKILEYDSVSDVITTKAGVLPTGKADHSCVENSATHKIYCFGGVNGSANTNQTIGVTNQIIEYDSSTDLVVVKSAVLPTARFNNSCAENSATHKIYCFGEQNATSTQILEYNPSTDTITTKLATMPSARASLFCSEDSSTHKIYCFGGTATSGLLNQIIEYNPETDATTIKIATLPTARSDVSCAENPVSHRIYCLGGQTSTSVLNEIIEYNPSADTVTTRPIVLPSPITYHSCAGNSATQKIYCFGGVSGGSSYYYQVREYTPPNAGPCTLTGGSWGPLTVTEGSPANLSVTTSGDCSGKQVAFDIREDTPLLIGFFNAILGFFGQGFAVANPPFASIAGSNASATWTSQFDTSLGASNSYYFLVSIVGGSGGIQSFDPKLTVNPAQNSCSFNLADGQTVSGNVDVSVNSIRTNTSYYTSLKLLNTKVGTSLQAIKQSSQLTSSFPSFSLYNNGPATLECHVQSSISGGDVVVGTVTVNVSN